MVGDVAQQYDCKKLLQLSAPVSNVLEGWEQEKVREGGRGGDDDCTDTDGFNGRASCQGT